MAESENDEAEKPAPESRFGRLKLWKRVMAMGLKELLPQRLPDSEEPQPVPKGKVRVGRWLWERGVWIPVVCLLAAIFFLMGAVLVNLTDLVNQNTEITQRLFDVLVAISVAVLLIAVILMVASIAMKLFGAGLRSVVTSFIEIVAISKNQRDQIPELQEKGKLLITGVKNFFVLLLIGFFTGLTIYLFQSLQTIANTMSNQQQVVKMKEQNQMLAIQQRFEMTRDEADRSFQQIADILLDPNSTPQQQVYALKQVPRAMTKEVVQIADGELTKEGDVKKFYEYPNIARLRDVLKQHMQDDRVGRALEKASVTVEGGEPIPDKGMKTLLNLGRVSSQLIITLYQLGKHGERKAIWKMDDPNEKEKQQKELGKKRDFSKGFPTPTKEIPLDLTHIAAADWKNAQLPYAFRKGGDIVFALEFSKEADFSYSQLQGAYLRGANLQASILRDAQLQAAVLSEANLQGARLEGANLQGTFLSQANLQAARLSGNLQGAVLNEANLQGADLSYADLQGADLSEANLQGADLSYANLQGADLSEANLQAATLFNANLQAARLEGANLQAATLLNANLQGADLIEANLKAASLLRADLQGARLERANLQGADLSYADLQGADLSYANLQAASLLNVNLQATCLSQANLQGAELWETVLGTGKLEFRPAEFKGRARSTIVADLENPNTTTELKAPIWTSLNVSQPFLRLNQDWSKALGEKLKSWGRQKEKEREWLLSIVEYLEKPEPEKNKDIVSRLLNALRRILFSEEDRQHFEGVEFESIDQPYFLIGWDQYNGLQRAQFETVWMLKADQEFLLKTIGNSQAENNKKWTDEALEKVRAELRAEIAKNVMIIPEGAEDFYLVDYAGRFSFRFPENTRMRESEKAWLLELIENQPREDWDKERSAKRKAEFQAYVEKVVTVIPKGEETPDDPQWQKWIERKLWNFQDELEKAWEKQQKEKGE